MTWLLIGYQVSYVLGFFSLFSVGSYGFTLLELVSIGILIYAGLYAVWNGKPLRIPSRLAVYAAFGLGIAFCLSGLFAILGGQREIMIQAFKTLTHFTMLWLTGMLLPCLPIREEQWLTAFRANVLVAFVVCLYGIYQVPARALDLPLGWIEITNASFARGVADGANTNQLALQFASFYRATSLFSEPSALAGYASFSVLLLLVPLFRGTKSLIPSRALTWIMTSVMLVALMMTFSLTGVMVLGSTMALAIVLFGKRTLRSVAITVASSAIVLIGANYVVYMTTDFDLLGTFSTRITSIASGGAASELSAENVVGESYMQRSNDYELSLEAWTYNPLLGIGPGCFSLSIPGKSHSTPFVSTSYGSVLAETGTVGFIMLVSMLALLLYELIRDYLAWQALEANADTKRAMYAPYLPLKMVQIIVTAFTGNTVVSAHFWGDIAILIGCQNKVRESIGTYHYTEVLVVAVPLRTRVVAWLQKGAGIGTNN